MQVAEAEMVRLDNRSRFILAVIRGQLVLSNRKKADIEADLAAKGFDRLPPKAVGKKVRAPAQ